MARQKGMLNLSGNLEPLAGAPLDSRNITPTVADLYIASNWPYKYIGMKTTVTATGDTYRLVNLDVTQESSWVKEGSSNLSDLKDVDLIDPEEGETLIYDGEGGWTNGPAGQTYSDFTGATSQSAGAHGLVPAPTTGDISKFLKGDGTWATVPMPSFDYSNTSPEAMNFSTDEKVIGTWIDGKPLYQKTVDCGTMPIATTKEIPLNISNVDKIVYAIGGANRSSDSTYISFPDNPPCDLYICNGNAYLVTTTDKSGYTYTYLTLRYTKTTDSAVASGEKIVGQWIDGKPLYQKTYDCGYLPNNSSITYTIDNFSSIERIVYMDTFATAIYPNVGGFTLPKINPDVSIYVNTVGMFTVTSSADYRDRYLYVTLRYTKTTN